MEIDKDTLSRKQSLLFSDSPPRLPTFYLIAIIAIGVAAGNGITALAAYAWARIQLHQIAQELEAWSQKQRAQQEKASEKARIEAEVKRLQAEQERRRNQIERSRSQNAARINAETCKFWNQQVQKENTAYNRSMRDAACKRATTQ